MCKRAAFWVLLQALSLNDWKQTAKRLKLQETTNNGMVHRAYIGPNQSEREKDNGLLFLGSRVSLA